jgi:DUF5010 C-terminal domain/Alginate lyase
MATMGGEAAASSGGTGGAAPPAAGAGAVAGSGGLPGAEAGGAAGSAGAPGSACADTLAEQPEGLVHPGGLHTRADLERMRYQVASGAEPWTTSFNQLAKDARASATYVVRGDPSWTDLQRGGTHGSEYESDATAAYLNALMWAITQDEAHARKCVEIFNTWKNLKAFLAPGTPALDAGLYAYKLLEAAEIVRSTYAGWSERDIAAFSDMLVYPGYSQTAVPASVSADNGTFYWRIYNGDPGRHGNQDLIAWRAMLIMGVFLDNRVMFERALRYFEGKPHRTDDLPYAPGPSMSGAQLADNEYFTTFQPKVLESEPDYGYNGVLEHYIWENGQLQESSRDQQHALLGLGMAAGMAEIAWNQGDAVWNSLDNRLLKGFEFTARYNASYLQSYPDQASAWEPSGDELIVRTDRTGRWRSKTVNPHFESDFTGVSRGEFPGKRPVFEQALAHFRVRMGLGEKETSWTARARELAVANYGQEPNGFSLDHPGWGGLTFARPIECAGTPLKGVENGLPVYGLHVVPEPILAANYDFFPAAGEGHTYHDLSPGNAGATYRRDDVDLLCGDDAEVIVTAAESGEWLTYTIAVPDAGAYDLDVRYRSGATESALALRIDRVDISDPATLPATSGAWRTRRLARVGLRAGAQALRVTVAKSAGDLALHSFTLHP